MGKKNKKLKKKKISAGNNFVTTDTKAIVNDTPAAQASTQVSAGDNKTDNDEFRYMKSDVKKILLIMLAIVIFVIVLYAVDVKTPYIQNIGGWFYKMFNIQTQ